jgi:hypothetical protein
MLGIIIFAVFLIFTFFMAVLFRARELKARKGAQAGVESYCCGKCGTCDKELPPPPDAGGERG